MAYRTGDFWSVQKSARSHLCDCRKGLAPCSLRCALRQSAGPLPVRKRRPGPQRPAAGLAQQPHPGSSKGLQRKDKRAGKFCIHRLFTVLAAMARQQKGACSMPGPCSESSVRVGSLRKDASFGRTWGCWPHRAQSTSPVPACSRCFLASTGTWPWPFPSARCTGPAAVGGRSCAAPHRR